MPISIVPSSGRGRAYACFILAMTLVSLACGQLAAAGVVSLRVGLAAMMVFATIVSLGAYLAARRAARAPGAADRRVWRYFALGLLMWAIGNPLYLIFLASGGDVRAPAFWSQIGFLLAYPLWYRALWLLRQPSVATSRRERIEALGLETSAILTTIILVGAILWRADTPLLANFGQLMPVTLDLLLGVALYNAARRTVLSRNTAYLWFLIGFLTLAATDAAVSLLVANAPEEFIAPALAFYAVALGMLGWATTQSLQATDARRDLTRSQFALAMVALALIGPASALTPGSWQVGWWVLGALIIWRLAVRFFWSGEGEGDPLTDMLEARDFERYLTGLSSGRNDDQPALLVGVDLNGFGAWNQRHGFAAGDALLSEVSVLLGGMKMPSNGSWGRLGADLFVWAGIGSADYGSARLLAQQAAATASDNRGSVPARAAFALMPRDAQQTADALSAIQEGLSAAGAMGRSVVAFDRGMLDGFEFTSGYTASLRQRRARVEEVLETPDSIRSVVQPIVELATGRVVGHEALSRFAGEPVRGPDHWIAEATAVGLGVEIEALCLRHALDRRADMPRGTYLSVNASADLIGSPVLDEIVGDGDLGWLVIELTEHEQVDDYTALNARLEGFRRRGARVAIDDAGAGHSSMRHIIELRPDLVKLDRSLISDVHLSEAQQAMIGSLVGFTARTSSKLVAEGAETEDELMALRALGVSLGQGYGIGRPAPEFMTDDQVPAILRPAAAVAAPAA